MEVHFLARLRTGALDSAVAVGGAGHTTVAEILARLLARALEGEGVASRGRWVDLRLLARLLASADDSAVALGGAPNVLALLLLLLGEGQGGGRRDGGGVAGLAVCLADGLIALDAVTLAPCLTSAERGSER